MIMACAIEAQSNDNMSKVTVNREKEKEKKKKVVASSYYGYTWVMKDKH